MRLPTKYDLEFCYNLNAEVYDAKNPGLTVELFYILSNITFSDGYFGGYGKIQHIFVQRSPITERYDGLHIFGMTIYAIEMTTLYEYFIQELKGCFVYGRPNMMVCITENDKPILACY